MRPIISTRRILGIDPGTATVGYGALIANSGDKYEYLGSGIIQTSSKMSTAERLSMIRSDLINVIEQYNPDVVVVEALFFFKNAKTVMTVSQARGVILETAHYKSKTIAEYTPMQVKLHLTGFGRSDKHEVQFMIAKLLGLPEIIRPDDASDALALAVCHARMSASLADPAKTG